MAPLVLLQQAFTNIKHTGHTGRRHHILPAVLVDMLGKVAPDDIAGSDPVQQLLRLLQAPQRQDRPGEGVRVLAARLTRTDTNLLLVAFILEQHKHARELCIFSTNCVLCHIFVLICHNKKKYFCITLKVCFSFVS